MLLNKEYWKEVIQEIEDAAHQKTLKDLIKNYDLSVTLPEDLQQRVKKIMPYEFDEYDRLVYIAESAVETPKSFDIEESTEDEFERRKVKKKVQLNWKLVLLNTITSGPLLTQRLFSMRAHALKSNVWRMSL